MPDRALIVSSPSKKASCSARFEGLRLAQGWSLSTSSSSSMSRIVSAPSRRTRATTRRTSSRVTPRNQVFGRVSPRMSAMKKRKSRVGT